MNQPGSFEDGCYSTLNNPLSSFELNIVVKFLKLQNTPHSNSEFKIFGRIRYNNQLFYAQTYDHKHKRQSSVCKWKFENMDYYGIIQKFVLYKGIEMIIASKFVDKKKLIDLYDFSAPYKSIFQLNDLDKYYPVFGRFENDENNLVVCLSSSLVSTCVMVKLKDSDNIMVTPIIGFEHD